MSFRLKMLISFIGLAVLCCGAVGFVSYRVSYASQREAMMRNYSFLLEQMVREAENRLENVAGICRFMTQDVNLQEVLARQTVGYEKIAFYEFINKYSFPIVSMMPVDSHVRLYVVNPDIPERYYGLERSAIHSTEPFRRRFEVLQLSRLTDANWRTEMQSVFGNRGHVVRTQEDVEAGTLSLLMNLYHFQQYIAVAPEKSLLAIVQVSVRPVDLLNVESVMEEGREIRFVLRNGDGEVLFAQGMENGLDYDKETWLTEPEAFGYFPLERKFSQRDMSIQALIPLETIKNEARRIWWTSSLITLMMMILFAMIGGLLSGYFSNYMQQIITFIQHIQDGDFGGRLIPKRRDELYDIAMALNAMAENMDILVNEVYAANLERTEAELRLLQSQINPHLLYNSLASINNLIRLNLTEKAGEVLAALTDFYRMSLGTGIGAVALSEELGHVKAYIAVKTLQLPGRVSVSYVVAEEVKSLTVPKIILQPIVENIFKHALYLEKELQIVIEAGNVANVLWIRISDNGIGMEAELAQRLTNGDSDGVGTGIRNVQQRIRLRHGSLYGVTVESLPGRGTCVTIQLPAQG